MTYKEWNIAIARHFLREENAGKAVFFCVTRDVIAEVSGLTGEQAISDFVKAINDGPEWTQIAGCARIPTKAMNCLYPDPSWRTPRTRTSEKRELYDHIYWCDFDSGLEFPPYIAYLACFVLSWTERDTVPLEYRRNPLNFYGPLNFFLALNGDSEINTNQFRPVYARGDKHLSMNALWRDLEEWCFTRLQGSKGVFYLPTLGDEHDYVFYPKYFGLFKGRDLRLLDHVFCKAEEASCLTDQREYTPKEMCSIIRRIDSGRGQQLSSACHDSLSSQDEATLEAAGQLLLSKYRQYDGVEEVQVTGQTSVIRARATMLVALRIERGIAKLEFVCRLRGRSFEKLPLSPDDQYNFTFSGRSFPTWWIADTPWFKPIPVELPLDQNVEFGCPALSPAFKSVAPIRTAILLAPGGSYSYCLAGIYLEEPSEMHVGREYMLLLKSEPSAALLGDNGISLEKRYVAGLPAGWKLWAVRVICDTDTKQYGLPPIKIAAAVEGIRLSGVRSQPRTDEFYFQFPPSAACLSGATPDRLEPVNSASIVLGTEIDANGLIPLTNTECEIQVVINRCAKKTFRVQDLGRHSKAPFNASFAHTFNSAYPFFTFEICGNPEHYDKRPTSYLLSSPPVIQPAGSFEKLGLHVMIDEVIFDSTYRWFPGEHSVRAMFGSTVIAKDKVHLCDARTATFRICGLIEGEQNRIQRDQVHANITCYTGDTPIVGLKCPFKIINLKDSKVVNDGTFITEMPKSNFVNVAWRKMSEPGQLYELQVYWAGTVVAKAQFAFDGSAQEVRPPTGQPSWRPSRIASQPAILPARVPPQMRSKGFTVSPFDKLDLNKGKESPT